MNYLNNFVGYLGKGAVNVMMYDYYKIFLPGNTIKIRIESQPKLTRVSYCWDDGERKTVKSLSYHRRSLKVRVPDVPGNKPVLKIITEVKISGKKYEHEHIFKVNNLHK